MATPSLEVEVVYRDGSKETVICSYVMAVDINANFISFLTSESISDIVKLVPRENIWQINIKKIEQPQVLN